MATAVDAGWETSDTASAAAGHHGSVNFDELVDHYFAAFPLGRPDGTSAKEIEKQEKGFRNMLAAFEADNGRVLSQTWCKRIESGAILTAKAQRPGLFRAPGDEIKYFASGNPAETDADLKLAELMAKADREAVRVTDLLRNPMRANALKQLYEVRSKALEGFEEIASRRHFGEPVTKLRSVTERLVAGQLKAAVDYAERAMRLRAALLFQLGMAIGAIVLMFLTGILAFFFDRREGGLFAGMEYVPTAFIVGAMGAVVSVLQRITRGQLATTLENGLIACLLLGVFRPVIGAVISVAIIVLILGEIIPIDVPEDAGTRAFFLGGIAFLAGFSERYAQTMLGAAKTGGSPTEETTTTTTTTTTDGNANSGGGTKETVGAVPLEDQVVNAPTTEGQADTPNAVAGGDAQGAAEGQNLLAGAQSIGRRAADKQDEGIG